MVVVVIVILVVVIILMYTIIISSSNNNITGNPGSNNSLNGNSLPGSVSPGQKANEPLGQESVWPKQRCYTSQQEHKARMRPGADIRRLKDGSFA